MATIKTIARLVMLQFAIAALLAFFVLVYLNHSTAMMPLLFLYFIASLALFIVSSGISFISPNLRVTYPIAFFVSLLTMAGALSWLSGNAFSDTLQGIFKNREKGFGMVDPYIISNIAVYVLAFKSRMYSHV